MPFIEGLEDSIKELNETCQRELEARYVVTRQSVPFRLLAEFAAEHDLHFYHEPAQVVAEVHEAKFSVPHKRLRRALRFKLGAGRSYPTFDTKPITPFMKMVGVESLDHWVDYYPDWEEYLSMLEDDVQLRVARELSRFDLSNIKLIGGTDCAVLCWVTDPTRRFPNEIHSAWLTSKPRKDMSLKELIFTPRPRTEAEWRNSILQKYQGVDI